MHLVAEEAQTLYLPILVTKVNPMQHTSSGYSRLCVVRFFA